MEAAVVDEGAAGDAACAGAVLAVVLAVYDGEDAVGVVDEVAADWAGEAAVGGGVGLQAGGVAEALAGGVAGEGEAWLAG